MNLVIESIGGNCPVQAEGMIGEKHFYFRSRGAAWQFHVADDEAGIFESGEWIYEEDYGEWPDAGWITEEEARAFIGKAAAVWWSLNG